jgi:hypothetical protein
MKMPIVKPQRLSLSKLTALLLLLFVFAPVASPQQSTGKQAASPAHPKRAGACACGISARLAWLQEITEELLTKEKSDSIPSFLFAETFKYYYLLFAAPQTLDFDNVIFNTEAHPIRRTW